MMRTTFRILMVLAFVVSLASLGCENTEEKKGGEKKEALAQVDEGAEAAPEITEPKKTEPAEEKKPPKVDREVLAKAFGEVYCAQKKGQTDKILDIYAKYGFETPKAWTEAWTTTAKDAKWQEEVYKRVRAECK